MIRAELIKLMRSATWVVAAVLPVVAVVTGTLNLANNRETLDAGWASFTSQVVLFYGLLFYSLGVGILAATVWRVEHRGGANWNLLASTTPRLLNLITAKIVAIALPVLIMQVVLVVGTYISGIIVLRLPGQPPWELAVAGALATVAALPLISVQSLLSMLLRSFAAPIALCLAGCVAGIAAVTSTDLRPLSYVIPQALNTRALNLGSTALAGSDGLNLVDATQILGIAAVLTTLAVLATALAIKSVKLR